MEKNSKALVLLSGGIDSAVCLYLAKLQHEKTLAISFDYYGRRRSEREATEKLAQAAGIDLIYVDVSFLREVSDIAGLQESLGKGMSQAYVPARNLIFYGIAAHFAETMGGGTVYGGHIKTDAQRFKDASKQFFKDLNSMLSAYLSKIVTVRTPLIDLEKHEVVRLGRSLNVPLELTWSCYEEGPTPCGVCEACMERHASFIEAGLSDPLNIEGGPGGI